MHWTLTSAALTGLFILAGTPLQSAAQAAKPAVKSGQVQLKGLDLMVIEEGDGGALVVNRASRTRNGDIASVDAMTLVRAPEVRAGKAFNWIESEEEVDCRAHRQRHKITYLHTADLSSNTATVNPGFRAWTKIEAASANYEAFMCGGTVARGFRKIPDLNSFQRAFFAKAATPAAAPAGGMKLPTVATSTYYRIDDGRSGGAMFLKASDAIVSDGLVNATMWNLLPKPLHMEGGMDVIWGGGHVIIDCKERRWRYVISSIANLDRSRSEEVKGAKFEPWSAILPGSGMERGEALMCNNRLVPGLEGVNDLIGYARQQQARGASPK